MFVQETTLLPIICLGVSFGRLITLMMRSKYYFFCFYFLQWQRCGYGIQEINSPLRSFPFLPFSLLLFDFTSNNSQFHMICGTSHRIKPQPKLMPRINLFFFAESILLDFSLVTKSSLSLQLWQTSVPL